MKILLIDKLHPLFNELMQKEGHELIDAHKFDNEKLYRHIREAEGLVLRNRIKIDKKIFVEARKLKFVARAGAGMENIDVEEARMRSIKCYNAPEGNRNAVGEHALAMLLAFKNNLLQADREVRKLQWNREKNRGEELKGKSIGIIGFGNTGSSFAKKLQGMEMNVLAYDKYIEIDVSEYPWVKQVDEDEIFDHCNILSLHLPLTNETRHLVCNDYLECFSKNIFIINTSRGAVVNTFDLVGQINMGKVTGAALDVLEFESLSFEEILNPDKLPRELKFLIESDKVILSPHVAGWTIESHKLISEVLAKKILADFKK